MRRRDHRRLPILSIVTPCVVMLTLAARRLAVDGPAAPAGITTIVLRTFGRLGRFASTQVAEVWAQVSGIIQERTVEIGAQIRI